MLVERRKEVLLQQLDLFGLDGWCKANQVEPGELGCTNLVKHEIRIVYDETFKEQF